MMFREKSISKFYAFALAVVFALTLAGCGGGGGTADTTEPPAPVPDPAISQRTAIESAITAARTAVAGLTDDASDAAIGSADSAVAAAKTAVMNASDVPDAEKTAFNTTIAVIEDNLSAKKTSIMAARGDAYDAMREAMAETGKLLHAALGMSPLSNIDNSATLLGPSGLTIDAVAGAGALAEGTDPLSVVLKAGDSAGALGSWNGMDYAQSSGTGNSKVTNEARVYTNRGPAGTEPFSGTGGKYELTGGSVTVDNFALVMAAAFTHQGTQDHAVPQRQDAVYINGTYDGAPGVFKCNSGCSSTNDGKGSPNTLGGTWMFTPEKGAMVSKPDANYLYYGWWVSKDNDGEPTAASAFTGIVGDVDGDQAAVNGNSLTGSATYVGKAVGKFAMSNPLDGTGNGGHFTADAELKATFGSGATAGMTGTIDNFRLNDGSEDPGWGVSLARGTWAADGEITAPSEKPTVWSINGNKAPASGTWSGTMYDEMPGGTPDGDGNNIPTTVTGTFASEFSSIGRMVGAFGADKQ